jgi:hypothetical protein
MMTWASDAAVLIVFLRMEARGRPRRSLARFLAVQDIRDAVRSDRKAA